MSDRFLKGIFEDCFRGVTSPITASVGGSFVPLSLFTSGFYVNASTGLFQNSNGTTAATINNDPVGYWLDQASAKTPIQATAGLRPLLQTALPSVKFDGVDDVLSFAGTFSATTGSAMLLFKTGATDFATRGLQSIISSADIAVANTWFEIGINASGKIYIEYNNAGVKQTVVGSSFLSVSTVYSLAVGFDGVDYFATLSGVEQNPLFIESVGTFGWFGSVVGADNLVLGGTVTLAGLVRPFQGEIIEAGISLQDITA